MVDRPPIPWLAFQDGKLFNREGASIRQGRAGGIVAGLKYGNKKSRKQVEKGERLFPEHSAAGQKKGGEGQKGSEKRRRWWFWPWSRRKADQE
jgi:hypothetical protein